MAQTLADWWLVDTTDDANDISPGDGSCGISGGTCSLRSAIEETNARDGLDVITIAPDIDPTLTIGGVNENAAATGDLDITDDLTISGDGAVVDAANLNRVLDQHDGSLAIIDTTITNGAIGSRKGGGIFSRNASALIIRRSTIAGNTTDRDGGGIYSNDGPITIVDSYLIDNSAGDASMGGAVYNDGGTLTIAGTTIDGNLAWMGGGLFSQASLTITDSTISANTATYGGGGIFSNRGALTVTNSTITRNDTALWGAGIFNKRDPMVLTASTVTDNASYVDRGAVASNAPATVSASVIAGNSGPDCDRPVASDGYNMDGDGSCGFDNPTDLPSQPPLLALLSETGGPTLTHLPFETSPIIDVIPFGANGCGTTISRDQRGVGRPVGSGCDIGATEGQIYLTPTPRDFTVDTALDLNDIAPGDGLCDSGGGACSLRAAIEETNAWPSPDVISIRPDIDPVLTILGGQEEYALTGDLDIRDALTINGDGATIDADGIDRVIDQHLGALTLTGITIAGGDLPTNSGSGAGILSHRHADLTLINATITRNLSRKDGGGVLFSEGTLVVLDSSITDNFAGVGGAGLSIGGGTANISNTAITENSAWLGAGGGINGGETLTIEGSTISGNTAVLGGGLVYDGTVEIMNTTISGNSAGRAGGGLAGLGGMTTATNTTITDNSSELDGAGILVRGGTHVFTNTTIAGNTALSGADAISVPGGVVTLASSVVASDPGPVCLGPVLSAGYNLATDNSCGFADPTDLAAQDPLLGSLADNGGPTLTRMPDAGSPLIDAIATAANGCGTTIVVDQRGATRPDGAGCDIGAVEGAGP